MAAFDIKEDVGAPSLQQLFGGQGSVPSKSAEDFKKSGNEFLLAKKFQQAVDEYSKAIAIDGSNPIYYANRAAALSQLNKHDDAVKDCESAIKLDAAYTKAYSRLGLAKFSLGKYDEAVSAYERSLELDPSNETTKQSLNTARQKARTMQDSGRSVQPSAGDGPGGMDLSALMNNPALMTMATQMMSNPQMASMMSQMMGGAQGEGGQPNLSALLNNPALRDMANQFTQGQGQNQPGNQDQ